MYTFSPGPKDSEGENFLKYFLFSLSQYVKILCNVVLTLSLNHPLQNDLKVVIAAGLTSSHPEQSS